jgi:hypothetical protein
MTIFEWVWKESLKSDGHQFHQYQQNKQSPLNLTELTEHKNNHDIWHWKSRSWFRIEYELQSFLHYKMIIINNKKMNNIPFIKIYLFLFLYSWLKVFFLLLPSLCFFMLTANNKRIYIDTSCIPNKYCIYVL